MNLETLCIRVLSFGKLPLEFGCGLLSAVKLHLLSSEGYPCSFAWFRFLSYLKCLDSRMSLLSLSSKLLACESEITEMQTCFLVGTSYEAKQPQIHH